MGFSAISEIPAADDAGRTWTTSFRKAVASSTTNTNGWIDYTYFSGSPLANFYASTPLVAAEIDPSRGIYLPSVAPATQHLNNLRLMSNANANSSTNNGRQMLALCDYLMYYPFIDTDAAGEQQDLDNTLTLPRYGSGQVIAVAQSASSAVGQFTMTYTNQDGVGGRVTPINFTAIVSGGGQLVHSSGAGASYNPYLHLQAGDSGVRSIESVTFTVPGGGLLALVIVKPLLMQYLAQECRRSSTGNLESYGSCMEFQSVIHAAGAPRIVDGARLGLLAAGAAGSLNSSILVGLIETYWK